MVEIPKDLAGRLEYTFFAAEAARADIEKLCSEARQQAIFGVCVNGDRVALARTLLEESEVLVVALVGFPLGANDTDAKRYETEIAVDQGAHEIDFVINLGRLKDGDHTFVLREMRDIVEAADERLVKAIVESHLLTREEKILVCKMAVDSGVKFVSTSSDFNTPPMTVEEVRLFREASGDELGIKAVGGINNIQSAQALLNAGAVRIGMGLGISKVQ